jgi:hypothetical protein
MAPCGLQLEWIRMPMKLDGSPRPEKSLSTRCQQKMPARIKSRRGLMARCGSLKNSRGQNPVDNMKQVPPEDLAALPRDGASQVGHYVYGLPKRDAG